ncbi:hypothetical protein QUB70_25870 [Microcoleus sp. A003_D6]
MPAKNLVELKQKSGYKQKSRADFTLGKVAPVKFQQFFAGRFIK